MAKTKEPGRRLHPEVRAFIDHEFARGKSAVQVYRELERLRHDERQRLRRLGDIDADELAVSYRVIAERRAWWVERQRASAPRPPLAEERPLAAAEQDGRPPARSPWWFSAPDDARVVLTAIAAWESATGVEWRLDREVARAIVNFARIAPDLPPYAIVALTDMVERWAYLPGDEERRRWDVLARFLGYRPWSSPEAAARYARAVGSGDRIELTEDGWPVYIVGVSVAIAGTSIASVHLTVDRDDAGHQDPSSGA